MPRFARLLPLLGLVLALAGCGSTAQPTTSASGPTDQYSFLITADHIAGLDVTEKTPYTLALHYFARHGVTGKSSHDLDFCELRFKTIGLRMSFTPRATGAPTPARCKFFDAIVQGRRWHTLNGLRVGDSAAQVRRLFPSAHWSPPQRGPAYVAGTISVLLGHPAEWLLNAKNADTAWAGPGVPELMAYTKAGHVIAFGNFIPSAP